MASSVESPLIARALKRSGKGKAVFPKGWLKLQARARAQMVRKQLKEAKEEARRGRLFNKSIYPSYGDVLWADYCFLFYMFVNGWLFFLLMRAQSMVKNPCEPEWSPNSLVYNYDYDKSNGTTTMYNYSNFTSCSDPWTFDAPAKLLAEVIPDDSGCFSSLAEEDKEWTEGASS